ncbi:MAG: hypothetical protein U1F43_06900 [Myxococcota bacterium]
MTASDYYRDLARATDPARRVGWESLAMQRLRFAAVRAELVADDGVLDLGAGLGDLGRYLQENDHPGAYLGIERDAELVRLGRAMAPPVALELGDALASVRVAAVAVALGTLVDGSSLRSDGVRFTRLRALFAAVRRASTRLGLVVVAKQEAIEARPVLAADDALGGMRAAELAWLEPDGAAELVDLSPVDWLVRLRRGRSAS